MFEAMNLALLIGASLIAVSTFTSLISLRIGAPLLVVFLAVGLGAGQDGPGGLRFDDAAAAYFIGSVALAVILFDSGFNTPLRTIRSAFGPSIVLATLGVLLTAGLVAVAARELLALTWAEALLLGAIVSSTDAAAVFFLLRVGGITLRDRVRSTLEVESGTNDPMAIFLSMLLVQMIDADRGLDAVGWDFLLSFATSMGVGLAAGLIGGFAIRSAITFLKLEAGLYPIVVLSLALVVFAATGLVDGSGYLAVYVAGLIAGNARLQGMLTLRRFQDGMTWFSQIAMFLTLGLLATPSQFIGVALPAVLLSLFLMLVGRPLAVWLCLLPFGFSRNETTFVAWVGLRGAVSILLAILPIVADLPNGRLLFNVTFLVVVTSLLIQGWTIGPMARWLGLIVPRRFGAVERVELELPGRATHELIAYRIAPDSPVARGEQRIPRWARPSLIVRDGRSIRVHDAGRLRAGDYVYIFAAPKLVHLLDRLFARPVDLDLSDREFFGDFVIDPETRMAELADAYGVTVAPADGELTVADYLTRRLQGSPEVGDRVALDTVELIVRELTDGRAIAAVGLAVEPSRAARPKLPLFQTRGEILDAIRRRLGRRRQPQPED